MSETICVTGATGFTGGHLVRRLIEGGDRVRALVRAGREVGGLERMGVEIVRGDLGDPEAVARAVRGAQTIYHVAATFRQEGLPSRTFRETNVQGTENVCRAALREGVERMVHTSTVGVQGHIAHPPATEDAPYNPGDLYQETKMEGEKVALRYFREEALPGVVVRPVGIYGPGDLRFLKLFRAIARRRFIMLGSGRILYHLTYVEDLIEGMTLAGTRKEALGGIYTLGGEEYTTLSDLTKRIADALGVPHPRRRFPVWPVWAAGLLCEVMLKPWGIEPPLYRRRVDFFLKDRAFDISRARRELGFQPRVGLGQGLARTARWYRERGLL